MGFGRGRKRLSTTFATGYKHSQFNKISKMMIPMHKQKSASPSKLQMLNIMTKKNSGFLDSIKKQSQAKSIPYEEKKEKHWKFKFDPNYNLYGYVPKEAKQKQLIIKTRKAMFAFKLDKEKNKHKDRRVKLLITASSAFLTVSNDNDEDGYNIKVRNQEEYDMLTKLFSVKRRTTKAICEFNLVRAVNRSIPQPLLTFLVISDILILAVKIESTELLLKTTQIIADLYLDFTNIVNAFYAYEQMVITSYTL